MEREIVVRLCASGNKDFWTLSFWAKDNKPLTDSEVVGVIQEYMQTLEEAVQDGRD